MRNRLAPLLLIAISLGLTAPLASSATYTGSWTNLTFGTTGPATIQFDVGPTSVSGLFDFDGPVFGAGDPPPIPFNAPLDANGSGAFSIPGTALGDISGSFDAFGNLIITITNIPGGVLTEFRMLGKFDLTIEKFDATYEIDNASGLFAIGVVEARVIKAPEIDAANRVKFKGRSAKLRATVVTNSAVQSLQAKASGKARVKLRGSNPYRIILKKVTRKTTRVRLTAANGDSLQSRKIVRFIRR